MQCARPTQPRRRARVARKGRTLILFPPQRCLEDTLRIWSFTYEANFPLAPLRLSSWLKSQGRDVDFVDAFNVHENSPAGFAEALAPARVVRHAPCGNFAAEHRTKPVYHVGLTWEALEDRLRALATPDEVYISSIFTWSWETTHRCVALVRRIFPRARVTIGGVYPTLCPEKAATSGAVVHEGIVPEAECARLDPEILPAVPRLGGIVIKSSIGCPHRCSYCAVHVLEGNRVVFRDPEAVLDELDDLSARVPLTRVYFWESNLLMKAGRHLGVLLKGLMARGNPYSLQAPEGLQPSLITPAIAAQMMAAGFREIRLTQETTDETRLTESRRPSDLRHVATAIEALCNAGFDIENIAVVLLIGQPGQTIDVILRDVVRIHALGVKTSFLVYTPIPRTADFTRYAPLIGDRTLEDLDSFLFPMASPAMTVAQIEAVIRHFNERHYPPARIAGSVTEDRLVRRMREMIRESEPSNRRPARASRRVIRSAGGQARRREVR